MDPGRRTVGVANDSLSMVTASSPRASRASTESLRKLYTMIRPNPYRRSADTPPRDTLRLETCLATVAHLDPGPIDGVSDAGLEHAVQTYADAFAKTDIMAMGRD